MSEPRIVTPAEALRWVDNFDPETIEAHLAHTVATERVRHEAETRAAVVKALRAWGGRKHGHVEGWADAIENGAPL